MTDNTERPLTLEEKVKKLATDFFYYWWNEPGNSTQEGYDYFIEKKGRALLEEILTAKDKEIERLKEEVKNQFEHLQRKHDENSLLKERIEAADDVTANLTYLYDRSMEARGSCYISSMERGEIERVIEKYNSLKPEK